MIRLLRIVVNLTIDGESHQIRGVAGMPRPADGAAERRDKALLRSRRAGRPYSAGTGDGAFSTTLRDFLPSASTAS